MHVVQVTDQWSWHSVCLRNVLIIAEALQSLSPRCELKLAPRLGVLL